MDLENWRGQIDELNLKLLQALNDRARCALEIAKVKKRDMLPVYDPSREKKIFENLLAHNTGPLSNESVERIFACIIEEHRRMQESA